MKPQGKNTTGSMLFAGILLLGLLIIAGSGKTTVKAAAAADAEQQTFSTPEEAGQALRAAAGDGDEGVLARVLGPDSKAILFSGDTTEDKAALAEFVVKYDRMNRWVTMTDGSRVLYIGADNYPYPIPLAQNANSRWYFNTTAGKDEILARRIGKNELLAIDAVSAMANAEELYFKHSHDGNPRHRYTVKILSTPGKEDGLYWEVPADEPSSPLGRLNEFAKVVVESTTTAAPPVFDGYSFRITTDQESKSFTIVATPVTYGDSGIMTFILSKGGQVQQKDLGSDTSSLAASLSNNDRGGGWSQAE
jgi:Protein of unknown function (DUF2950)